MTTTYGITPTGFLVKPQQVILQELSDDQKANIDPNWDTSSDSPAGQENGTFSRQAALAWEALQDCSDGLDPDKAEDAQLVSLCKISGTTPRPASYTIVTTTCDLVAGTALLSGVHFANVSGLPNVRATPLNDYIALTSGLKTLQFRAEDTGPIPILAGTLTVKNTSVTGWNSVTNAADGVLGMVADTSETLRPRRVAELAGSGSTTAKALRAKLLGLVVNGQKPVLYATVYVNETDYPNVNGLFPHSIECVIFDAPTVPDFQVARAIWDGKAPSVQTRGLTSFDYASDSDGDFHRVYFSRAIQDLVYLSFDIKIGNGYVGDAAFVQAVASKMSTYSNVGAKVLAWNAEKAADQAGVANLIAVRLGLSASPTGTTDLLIGPREIAVFDTSRIVVNHV